MKLTLTLAVLAALLIAAQATFSGAEMAARVAIEVDDAMAPLKSSDIITQADFSPAEYEAMSALTSNEFFDGLEGALQQSEREVALASFDGDAALVEVEKDKKKAKGKGKAKKGKKGAGKKGKKGCKTDKKKGPTMSIKTKATRALLAKAAKAPAESKKKVLDKKAFAKDEAYEFVDLKAIPSAPKNMTKVLVSARKGKKALLKRLVKKGKKYMKRLLKLRKAAKKYIEEKEWDVVKKIAKRIEKLEDKMDLWTAERDAAFALGEAANQVDGWHDQLVDFKDAVNENYAKKQEAKTLKIRKTFDKYLKDKKADKVLRMKAKALKALRDDLKSLKGRALQAFAKRYKAALIKKFGAKKVKHALKKGAKKTKKAMRKLKKKGIKGKKAQKAVAKKKYTLKYLKKATKGKAHAVLISVAAHLPTVGPYIRAGLVSDEAGHAALPLFRRW